MREKLLNDKHIFLAARSRFTVRGILMMVCALCFAISAQAQSRTIAGYVYDNAGEPIIGATVMVDGTNQVAVSGVDGSFSLAGVNGDVTLNVTYFGFTTVSRAISAGTSQIEISMERDTTLIDDVVVVGYGVQKKETLTGSVVAIANKEIAVTKNENVINMLSGKVPGLRITQPTSRPGSVDDMRLDVRGFGTPLIVVDGLLRDKGYFGRMDVNEIDNISLIKDGTAAVYGVGAENGVIIITTKKGPSGGGDKFNITLAANFGWQDFLYVPHTTGPIEMMDMMNEIHYNNWGNSYPARTVPVFDEADYAPFRSGKKIGTNWHDEMFARMVPQNKYNLSLDGSSEKINYFFNVGYMTQAGSYKSGDLNNKRWNFRNNTEVKITNRLKASVQLGGYMDVVNSPRGADWTVYKKAWTYRPTAAAWVNGDHDYPASHLQDIDTGSFLPSETDNPVALMDSDVSGYNINKRIDINSSLGITYDIPGVDGLSVRASYNYNYRNTDNTSRVRSYSLYSLNSSGVLVTTPKNETATLERRTEPGHTEMVQLALNYANSFGDHNVSGMLTYEERYNESNGFYARRQMEFDSDYLVFGEITGQEGGQNGLSEDSRRALIGRATYDYKGRYMAEFAFRYDGASNYPDASRWGFFPSASIGWRLSEENFIKDNVSFIDNLKIRASYGQIGALQGGRGVVGYRIDSENVGWLYNSTLIGGVRTNAIPNMSMTWATASFYNLGIDVELWNGKLTATFEAYQRKRTGLLRAPDVAYPFEVGFGVAQVNMESDKTFGYELSLGHQNRIGAWSYWVNGQISAAKNRWIYRLDGAGDNSMNVWRRRDLSGRNKDIWFIDREEGGRFTSYDQIRDHHLPADQYALPGDYWYEDWNGDGSIDGDDSHPYASYNLPVFNYGLSLGAAWKGIDIAMNFQGAAGVFNRYEEVFSQVAGWGGAIMDVYMDRWHMVDPNDDPFHPETKWVEGYYPASGRGFMSGSTGVKNASYVRLKTLEIGYTLPQKWISKIGAQSLRVYVSGYNLLTISGMKNMDPERPGTTGVFGADAGAGVQVYNDPNNRTVNVGATLTF